MLKVFVVLNVLFSHVELYGFQSKPYFCFCVFVIVILSSGLKVKFHAN